MTDYVYQHRCREVIRDKQGRAVRIADVNLPHGRDAQQLFRDYFHRDQDEMLASIRKHVSRKIVSYELHPDYTCKPGETQVAFCVQTEPHVHLSQRQKKKLWDHIEAQLASEWGLKLSNFIWTDAAGNKFSIR